MKSFSSVAAKSNCIQLHRFVRLGDKADSQVFTFIVPSQLTRRFINTAQSKEFPYGGQSWQLQLCLQQEDSSSKSSDDGGANGNEIQKSTGPKNTLSVGLGLCGGLAGMHCQLELIRYTILNRESIHCNRTYEERHVAFTADDPLRWKHGWISTDRLSAEHFYFDDWTWLIEVELQGATTIYEESFTHPKLTPKDTADGYRFESASFTFSGSDWNVTLSWNTIDNKKHSIASFMRPVKGINEPSGNTGCPIMKLQRHSRTNHWCRVRYKATLIWGALGEASFGPVDHLITADNGATTAGSEIGDAKWFTAGQMPPKQRIKIIIEMLAAAPVSRIDLIPIAPQGGKNFARCRDPDGHDWMVLSDIFGTLVRLRFFPVVEIHHFNGQTSSNDGITKDGSLSQMPDRPCELRCVAWNVHLIPHESSRGVVKALSSPYVSYVPTFRCSVSGSDYNRRASADLSADNQQMMIHPDEVTEVALDLPVEKVRIQISRIILMSHNQRELRALQLENYELEKQLYMSNAPNSIELNVPELQASALSQSLKQLSGNSSLPSSPELSTTTQKSSNNKRASNIGVGRRLPDASNLTSPKNGGFLSANNNMNVRRHSSTFGGGMETQGRPRRSLPSPGVQNNNAVGGSGSGSGSGCGTSWRNQKRCVGDEDFSEGYKSREDSPVQQLLNVSANGGSTGNVTNMSSPIRNQPYVMRKNRDRQTHQLRPHTATSATSLAHPGNRDQPQRSLTPTLVFSLSSEDSVSGGGGGNISGY
ncbi:unnamed protein product [Rodentolepis nana]|uniref:MATH domain-containing protein n=1 Tax=Rodentolepis nana TaxID=102285 RepID=A0A158QHY1_RODNA|nr:unnamed protein product [Rodentolepis nana]